MNNYALYSKTKQVYVNRFVSDPFKREKIVSYIPADKKLKRNIMTCATKESATDIAARLSQVTNEKIVPVKIINKGEK